MDEFNLIANYLNPLAGPEGLGLIDDAALYTPPSGFDLVLTKDTMVEGVHFPKRHYGADTAEKLLRVNLSDLAAKGARPVGYLLSIAWPKSVSLLHNFPAFVKGLQSVQENFGFSLFGGDTVSIDGPLVVSATLLGLVPTGEMIRRSGADVGDDIWVSGSIGDAALGLKLVLGHDLGISPEGAAIWAWEEAYFRPEPRIIIRKLLRKYAKACADVSDGLIADLDHIAKASDLNFEIQTTDIPISKASQTWLDQHGDTGLVHLITAGDDYELAFLADPLNRDLIRAESQKLGVRLTKIGMAVSPKNDKASEVYPRVQLLRPPGANLTVNQQGYRHF